MNKILILAISMTVALFSFGCSEDVETTSSSSDVSVVEDATVVDETIIAVDEAVNSVTGEDAVDEMAEPINATIDKVNDAIDETVEPINETIDEVNDGIEETAESINGVVDDAAATADESIDTIVDEADVAVSDTIIATDKAINAVTDEVSIATDKSAL
jgi:hypothetical protein